MATFVDRLFDRSVPGLIKALDLHMKRNEALVSNIANAETPQYRASDVSFAGELKRAFGENSSEILKTNPRHMDVSGNDASHLVPDYSGATRADGNNVDLDIQMARLAQTSGRYSIAANLMRRKLMAVREAIRQV